MSILIYLLESNEKRAQNIINAVPGKEFQIEVVSQLSELIENIDKSLPDALFIGYKWIQDEVDSLNFLKNHYSLIYGNQIDVNTKLKLYEKGATRVLELREGSETILFLFYNNYLYRQKELKPLIQKYVTYGDLNEFQLRDILLNSILEKRNFIIKIQDNYWPAKIRTYQGEIVEAVCPGHAGEEAALRILQHRSGYFRLQSYAKPQEISTSSISTLGLIVEAEFESEILKQFVKKFGIRNPIFQKSKEYDFDLLTPEEKIFVNKIEEWGELQKILKFSPFSRLKALRYLEKFYQTGAISIDIDRADLLHFGPEDIQFIRERLYKNRQGEGKLIILGYPDSGKTQIIKTLAKIHQAEVKTIQSLDFTHLHLADDLKLSVFGISIDSYFQPVIKKLASNMLACFFILDFRQSENVEYLKYLIQQFIANYHVPLVFALTNVTGDVSKVIAEMREKFEIPDQFDLVPLNPSEFYQIKQLFYHLKDNPAIEEI